MNRPDLTPEELARLAAKYRPWETFVLHVTGCPFAYGEGVCRCREILEQKQPPQWPWPCS